MGEFQPDAHLNGWSGLSITALISNRKSAICLAISILYNMPQSYKIFVKDVPIIICSDINGLVDNKMQLVSADDIDQNIGNLVDKLDRNESKGIIINTDNPEDVFSNISREFEYIHAAGGIVWNLNAELLMIFRRGKWDLPKGKVEAEESLPTAALREVEEESGVGRLRIVQKVQSSYHIYMERKVWVLKETHWFEMLSSDKGLTVPQKSEGITEAHWVPMHDIQTKLKDTYASIKYLMDIVLKTGYKGTENN